MSLIRVEIDNRLAVLTMANQSKRNALSEAMIDGILAGLDQALAAKVRCVILRAEPGVRIWSSGHDISELPKSHRTGNFWCARCGASGDCGGCCSPG